MTEYVPDPEFNDGAAWSFVGSGASITGGQLRFINATIVSSDTVPHVAAEAGKTYQYRVVVATYATSPFTARIQWGGVEIYNKAGAGVFTGEVTASTSAGLIFQATLAGQWFLDSISISRPSGRLPRKRTAKEIRKLLKQREKEDRDRKQEIEDALDVMLGTREQRDALQAIQARLDREKPEPDRWWSGIRAKNPLKLS